MDKLLHYLALLKEYTRDYVLENTGLKVLALLITAVLWLSVASRPVSQVTLRDVPIEYRNLPDDPPLTVSESTAVSARVYIEGPRDLLDQIRSTEVVVYGDLTGVEAGTRVRELMVDASRLPPSVKYTEVEPRNIRVTVERIVESGDLPIDPQFSGDLPPGYTFTWTTVPKTVKVVGPESVVRQVFVVSTETVILTGKTESFSKRVAIDIGKQNLGLSPNSSRDVVLTVVIGKERSFDRVPVTLVNGPAGKEPVPKFIRVSVFGEGAAIDAMSVDNITATIDLEEGATTSKQFTPKISISPQYSGLVTVRSFEPESFRLR